MTLFLFTFIYVRRRQDERRHCPSLTASQLAGSLKREYVPRKCGEV